MSFAHQRSDSPGILIRAFCALIAAFVLLTPVPGLADGNDRHDNDRGKGHYDHGNGHGYGHDKDKDKDKDKKDKIKIRFTRDLVFGRVGGDADGYGEVTINAATGSVTVAGLAYEFGGRSHEARVLITGEKNKFVTIHLPNSVILKSRFGQEAKLYNFKTYPSGLLRFDHDGKLRLKIGGTLRVAAGQPPARYRGKFELDVDYH